MAFNLVLWKKDTELYILSSTFPKNLKQLSLQHIEYEYIYIYIYTHTSISLHRHKIRYDRGPGTCVFSVIIFAPPKTPKRHFRPVEPLNFGAVTAWRNDLNELVLNLWSILFFWRFFKYIVFFLGGISGSLVARIFFVWKNRFFFWKSVWYLYNKNQLFTEAAHCSAPLVRVDETMMYITTPIRLIGGSTGIQKSCELTFFFLGKFYRSHGVICFFFRKKYHESCSHKVSYIIIIFIYLLVSVRFPKFCRPSPSQKISCQIDSILERIPPKKVEVSASATNFSWLFLPGFVGSPQSLGFSTPRNCAFETFGRKNITSQLGETWEFWVGGAL